MELRVKAAWWVGEAINDRESSVMAVTAGLGSGKTHGGSQWHHHRVRDNEGCNFSAFMEPSFQKVMDTAIPTYQKVLQSFGMSEGSDYKLVKSPYPKIIYLDQKPNHEVHFLSAETPDKIAGVEYCHASEDEAGINAPEARRNLRGRLYRDPKAKIAQYLVFGAPQGINDFADEFDSETQEGWERPHPRDHYKLTVVENVVIRRRRFILWTDDNPFVSPQYLAELQDTYGHNPNLIRSYRYGQFCPLTEGAAFNNYLPQLHDFEGIEANPYLPIVMCWDFNAQPLAWVGIQSKVVQEHIRRRRHYALHEANEGAQNLDDACVEFAVKFPVREFRDTPILIYGDRTGHAASHKISGSDYENIESYLRKLGYNHVEIKASRQVAPEASSVDALNKLFMSNNLHIHRRCRMLRRGLLATVWKDGTRKLDKPAGETHTHHPDAVKYWAWQERASLYEVNQILGKN